VTGKTFMLINQHHDDNDATLRMMCPPGGHNPCPPTLNAKVEYSIIMMYNKDTITGKINSFVLCDGVTLKI
jgi:hypothetical protein